MIFRNTEDKKWMVYNKGKVVAEIKLQPGGGAFISNLTSDMLPLSALELLTFGVGMIADRHPDATAKEFTVDYRRVEFAKKFLKSVEFGNKDSFNGFIEAAKIHFGHY